MRTFLKNTLFFFFLFVCLSACNKPVTDNPAILAALPDEVDFNYHIRPLLSDRCFACHGPDENTREAGFRLDTEEGAFAKLTESDRKKAIVPGSIRRSELVHRITSDGSDYVMPPEDSNLQLTEYEKALLKKWIKQGAEWKEHWAFTPPERPALPEISDPEWAAQPVDYFVMARLDREGITPSKEADKERLLRRVSFDLTGLPPTIEEIDAFLDDESDTAYEKAVDRLLASKAYAERMAVDWMDLSRYADSHGYHADGYRMMWPWRDWVIEAFDENMPYDKFVTLQLAGDLMPESTHEMRLATAFNRNHQMTAEGGVVDEEYRLEYVADRTNTVATAFLGLTMECAKCHDHKFDPISQREYFQLSAFFNNVNEVGMTGDDGNAGPMLQLYEDGVEDRLKAVRDSIAAIEMLLAARYEALGKPQIVRTGASFASEQVPVLLDEGLSDHYSLNEVKEVSDDRHVINEVHGRTDGSVSGDLEIVDSPVDQGIRFDHDFDYLELESAGLFDRYEPFSVGAWVYPEKTEVYEVLFGNAGQKNSYWRGHETFLDSLNRVNVRFIHALPHNQFHVRTVDGLALDQWNHLAFTYDGSSKARGVTVYIDGAPMNVEVVFDDLYKSMLPVNWKYTPEERPIRVGKSYRAFTGDDGVFMGRMDDIRMYNRMLTGLEVATLAGLGHQPSSAQLQKNHQIERADHEVIQLRAELQALRKKEHDIMEPVEEIMVMEEMPEPRPTYVLARGDYSQPEEQVFPGTPVEVFAFPDNLDQNRLGLSQWLMDPENPLTARVAVNRFWQKFFGQGLVTTPADFGYQGKLPSHPALLDWLATAFVESGWDMKAMQKQIVLSSTYRQSSAPRADLEDLDPENILLARGPRYRLTAEMIRDNALAASGLLVCTVGGPSVKPYQPEGLWIEKSTFSAKLLTYEPDTGEGLYRRSLYTFVKRTSPPPSMIAFDATDRSICIVERQATSTPLQSLILMNDPQYVEASRVLAERMQKEGGDGLDDQITLGFRLLTGRYPVAAEVDVFRALYKDKEVAYQQRPGEALELLDVGDWQRDASLDPAKTAALTMVANTMMNHDEAYMKR